MSNNRPSNKRIVDPQTGLLTLEWDAYFARLDTVVSAKWTLIDSNLSPGTVSAVNFSNHEIISSSELLIVVNDMTVSGSSSIRFAFSIDSGITFLNIAYQRLQNVTGSENHNSYIEPSVAEIESKQGFCNVKMPRGSYKPVFAHGSRSSAQYYQGIAYGIIESTDNINYVRVSLDSNNITGGAIQLFGRL